MLKKESEDEKKENDKTKVHLSECSKRINKIGKDINANDKEACSLLLLMDLLAGGYV